jgi:hypothetical protein
MRSIAALTAVALAACATAGPPHLALAPDPRLAADDAARIDAAIAAAGAKLRDLVQPDGHFVYEYRVADGRDTGDYNIVRHAGAIYALAMWEARSPDPRTRAAIASAAGYLVAHALQPISADTRAVFSIDAEDGTAGADAALGAAGLGLVALIAAEQLAPDSIGAPALRALGNFIVLMQRDDGSFFSTYERDGGRSNRFDSLYYPGEAILALTRLSAFDHDPRWHDAALKGLLHLAAARAQAAEVPSDNWALVATAELLAQGVSAEARARLLHHAAQIASVNLEPQVTDRAAPFFGCYGDDGRTTPSATHLEGLLAAASYLPRTDLRPSIDAGIHFLLESQLGDGALPGDQHRKTVRIDFIQHALSAFIRYRALYGKRT